MPDMPATCTPIFIKISPLGQEILKGVLVPSRLAFIVHLAWRYALFIIDFGYVLLFPRQFFVGAQVLSKVHPTSKIRAMALWGIVKMDGEGALQSRLSIGNIVLSISIIVSSQLEIIASVQLEVFCICDHKCRPRLSVHPTLRNWGQIEDRRNVLH